MPRNSSGSMVPANGPYIVGTVADPTLVNARFADEESEIGSSLDRTGRGGMLAPLRSVDGTVAAPAYSFTSETGTGAYRAGASDYRISLAGVDRVFIGANGLGVGAAPTGTMTLSSPTQPSADFVSSNPAAAAGNKRGFFLYDPGVQLPAPGWVFQSATDAGVFISNALIVQRDGLIRLGTPGTQVQPASIWTAITPDTNITASAGAAYWKDATGRTQLKGQFVNNTGAATSNWATTTPLPVGFRPSSLRQFTVLAGGTATILMIGTDGTIKTSASVANGLGVSLDGVSFLAEQ